MVRQRRRPILLCRTLLQLGSIEVSAFEQHQRHFQNLSFTPIEFEFLGAVRCWTRHLVSQVFVLRLPRQSNDNPSPTLRTCDARASNAIGHAKIIWSSFSTTHRGRRALTWVKCLPEVPMMTDPAFAIKTEVSQLVDTQIDTLRKPSSLTASELDEYHSSIRTNYQTVRTTGSHREEMLQRCGAESRVMHLF
jgi:hypothetical protein